MPIIDIYIDKVLGKYGMKNSKDDWRSLNNRQKESSQDHGRTEMQSATSVFGIDYELAELLHQSISEIDKEHTEKFTEILFSIRAEIISARK
jgi:hypothetical protein